MEVSASQSDEIRDLLSAKGRAGRSEQKTIRRKLRDIGFRITDFDRSYRGFTVADFDRMVGAGRIVIRD